MPSSSASSRSSAAARSSPGARFPPGNSHAPARWVPARRWFTSQRPCPSPIRPTSTCTRSGLTASAQAAVALLVFLPRAAWAGLVAPHLRLLAHVLSDRLGLGLRAAREAPGGQLAASGRRRRRGRRGDERRRHGVLEPERARIRRLGLHGL